MFRNRVPELADRYHVTAPDRVELEPADRRLGGETVLVGSIEAAEVGDGRLTAIMQLGCSGERVRLCVPAVLWPAVRRYLCTQVAASGRLRRTASGGRMMLELLSVDPVEL